jgi:hypothetical protein
MAMGDTSNIAALELRRHVEDGCRRLLTEQNRDPYTPTYGCFDRRYWGWKLVDYAEATFQRGVYPLAWQLWRAGHGHEAEVIAESMRAGLAFALRVQHRDGSFDQAFPNEHSFGATAFLLHPLLAAYDAVAETSPRALRDAVERGLLQAGRFLCSADETHGHIANHLAGAALSLFAAAQRFSEPAFASRAERLVEQVLKRSSPEGWFLEYDGADPGYQTLCLSYLAQIYRLRPDSVLRAALERAVSFLAWFVHPDGTFAGEYGSRRTGVFYPGGFALLADEMPLARSILRTMVSSIVAGRTPSPRHIDVGNLAPLLSAYLPLVERDQPAWLVPGPPLPCEMEAVYGDFPDAGLHVRGTSRYYAVLGASNGGVLKVYSRQLAAPAWLDGGYAGQLADGRYVTTQITDRERSVQASAEKVTVEAPFYEMLRAVPAPPSFVVLRLLNLTAMRSVRLGNLLKAVLVRLLVSGRRRAPLHLRREVCFTPDHVSVHDRLQLTGQAKLRWLAFGRPFTAIHMASARYFEHAGASVVGSTEVNVAALADHGTTTIKTVVPQ